MPVPAVLDGKLTLPVIGSPMFIVSTPELVIAQCKAGIVGSFPALNARPREQLAVWLARITTELAAYRAAHPQMKVAPFAVSEANASEEYKQMIITSAAEDIVYTALFSGIHGNYLKHSVLATGLDPDNLPLPDKNKMNFGSGEDSPRKAWRDIWSAGQGVGQIDDIPSTAEQVERLRREYDAARARLALEPR